MSPAKRRMLVEKVRKAYIINPEQAETVKIIFDLYVHGYGEKKIANELCRLHRKDSRGNINWSCTKISRIINNATYKGFKCYLKSYSNNFLEQKRILNNDKSSHLYMKGDFEPIIPEEVWDKCERIRNARTIMVPALNGKTKIKGHRGTKDVWIKKLKCICGASFRKNKWRTNKRGDMVFGYQCYNQLNYGSRKTREKFGLPTDGYCDIKMIGDWKLELMAKMIFEEIWLDRKEAVKKTYEIISECYIADKHNKKDTIQNFVCKIKEAKEKAEQIINMYLENLITKEEYTKLKNKCDCEIEKITKKKTLVESTEQDDSDSIDVKAVSQSLEEYIDFSRQQISHEIIDKFVNKVTPIENNRFEWHLDLVPNKRQVVPCEISGRKNAPKVTVSNLNEKQNTSQSNEQHMQS